MTVTDWRQQDADRLAPLYAVEAERWRRDLWWDTSRIWREVEEARRAGVLPGFVAHGADGRVRGWSFHMRHRDSVQLGGLVADTAEATAQLLDAVERSPEAASASAAMAFGHFAAPGLEAALAARGMVVERYRYLARRLPAAAGPTRGDLRSWQAEDLMSAAAVLASAYGADPARPFAPGGRLDEWMAYLGQLLGTHGCGEFAPEWSVVAPAAGGGLEAVALVTRLAPDTAHLAQLAVRPEAQGRAAGTALLASVLARSRKGGCHTVTLLVAQANRRAGRLYERAGFSEVAVFVSGSSRPRTALSTR